MINSLEDIRILSDDDLFRELKKKGANPGPISPTTRSVYEKKLGNILFGTKFASKLSPSSTNSNSPTAEFSQLDVENYSDEELFRALKNRGLNPGPIMPTTRHIYEKKLLDLIKKSKLPGHPNLDRSVHASPKKASNDSFTQCEFDTQMPNFSNKKESSLFPSLKFKLIDKEIRKEEQDQDSFLRINNFENSKRFGEHLWKYSHPNDKNNGSYLDYIRPKNQLSNKIIYKPNRKLNLDPDIFENRKTNSVNNLNTFYATGSTNSLYDEPPPSQSNLFSNPSQVRTGLPKHKFTLTEFLLQNYKLIFIIISILIILSILFSNSNDNPIEL